MPETLPLSGVIVLELGARIAASVAGSMLAQLGATVIFVDGLSPPGDIPTKFSVREQFAAGKLSLKASVENPLDRELLAALARCCDVVLVSSDLDLPRLPEWEGDAVRTIVCDITAFGNSGPKAGTSCSDAQIQALSGILEATGNPTGAPTCVGVPIVEHISGLYAAGAVLCALRQRRLQGIVQAAEVSLYDVAFASMTSFLAPAFHSGADARTRVGNRHTMAAPWNVYRARDGWVLLCAGSDEQWQRICQLLGQPALAADPRFSKNASRVQNIDGVDAAVQAWVGQRSVADCIDQLNGLGLPSGPVVPIKGHPQEQNLIYRGMVQDAMDPLQRQTVKVPGSAFRMSRTPGLPLTRIPLPDADRAQVLDILKRPHATPTRGRKAPLHAVLDGVRVIEIGHYTTVPLAARTLGSLGAEVIKIEPAEGEAVRRWPPARNGQGIFFTFQNSDKKSMVLDLDAEPDRELLTRLIGSADILVENLRPGALSRKGFSPEKLQEMNPRLVYCSISGFGSDSLYPGRAAFDMVIQAMSGLMDATRADGMPIKAGPSISDGMGAAFGFVAMLAALEYRDAAGVGQHVDLSMQDISAVATQTCWNDAALAPLPPIQRSKEGSFVVGEPGDVTPILHIGEVLKAPQTQARRLWFPVDLGDTSFPLIAVPFRLAVTPPVVEKPGPALGSHTQKLIEELSSPTNPA